TGRVYHHMRRYPHPGARLAVDRDYSVGKTVGAASDLNYRSIVEQNSAVVGCGGCEVDQQARVVELAVVVNDPATETIGLDGGQALQGFFPRQEARFAEAVFAGEQVVHLHPDTV